MTSRNECQSNCRNIDIGNLACDSRKSHHLSKDLVYMNLMSVHTGFLDSQDGTGKSKHPLVSLDMNHHYGTVLAYAHMLDCVLGRIACLENPLGSCIGNRNLDECRHLHYGTASVYTDLDAVHIESH